MPGFTNLARFKQPDFDRLYEQARSDARRPGARRSSMQRMSRARHRLRAVEDQAYRYENVLVYPWVAGYKYNAFNQHPWPYFDVDSKRRKTASP